MSFHSFDPEPNRCRNYRQAPSGNGYQRPFRCTLDEGHDSRCEFVGANPGADDPVAVFVRTVGNLRGLAQ